MKNPMKKQSTIIAVLLIVAALFGTYVLLSGRAAPAGEAEHAEGKAEQHDDHDGGHKEQPAEESGGHAEQGGKGQAGANAESNLVPFTDAQVKSAGIALATAGPVQLDTFVRMPGEIGLNEDRTAHVTPRSPGAVESVSGNLGERVTKGTVLAIVSSAEVSNQRGELAASQKRLQFARTVYAAEKQLWEDKVSARQDYLKAEQELREAEIAVRSAEQRLNALGAGWGSGQSNRLEVRAPFAGVIVEKHVAQGEVVDADTRIFTISDLSTVWADVVVPAKDLDLVRVGTAAVIRSVASDVTAPGKVSYVSALIGEETRSAKARVVLSNPGGAWRPGLFVNVDIVTGSARVPVAVAREAVQRIDGRDVVFVKVDQGFRIQQVVTGRTDGRVIEIVRGLREGERYAATGSFTIKAEQGKEGAEHEH